MRIFALPCAVLGLMAAPLAVAQEPSATWQYIGALNGVRGEVKAMALAANGDIVVAGHVPKPGSGSGRAQNDGWVARFSADGRELWSRTVGGPLRDEMLQLAIGADGTITAVGWRDIQEARGWSVMAVRLSTDGDVLWDKTLGNAQRISASSIAILDDGGALLGGREIPKDEAGERPLLIRLSSAGEVMWMRNAPGQPAPDDEPPRVMRNGVFYAYDGADIGPVRNGKAEIRFDRIGGLTGNTIAGCVVVSLADGSDTGQACWPGAIQGFWPDRRYHGGSTSRYSESDIVVTRHKTDGVVEWQRQPKTPWGDGINAVAETPDGGVVAAGFRLTSGEVGRHNWDGLLVRFDADGKLLWSRQFGGTKRDEFNSVAVLADGTIIAAGYTGSQPDAVDWAPWILRLTADGELEGAALKQIQERQF